VIKRGTIGTGITEKPTISFDSKADLADPEVAAAVETGTLDGLLSAVERECFAVMRQEGLPTYHGCYLHDGKGNWRPPGLPFEGFIANEIWPIAEGRGHSPDSPVGFAAQMLSDAVWIRRARERGDHDRAALLTGYLVAKMAERRIKGEHEATWESGKGTRAGARLGAEKRAAAFRPKHERIRADFEERLSRTGDEQRAKNATARAFEISRRQLNRILAK
jgi:hypothetical protein